MKRWPPDPLSISYQGPYPIREIHQARGVLIRCLQDRRNLSLQSVLPKIGIDLINGCVIPSTLPPIVRNASPVPFANGLRPADFVMNSTEQFFSPRRVLPLMRSPTKHAHHSIAHAPESQHFQRQLYDEDRMNFAVADKPFILNSADRDFMFEPLLPTPVDSSFMSESKEDYEEHADSDYSNSAVNMDATNALVHFGNRQSAEQQNISSIDHYNQEATLSFPTHDDCSKLSVDVQKAINIDISSDTLRQILAMVGKTKTEDAELESQGVKTERTLNQDDQQTESSLILESDEKTAHSSTDQSNETDMPARPSSVKMQNSDEIDLCFNKELENVGDVNQMHTLKSEIKTGDEKTKHSKLSDVFKCDYCQRSTCSLDEMKDHLIRSKHLTASKYLGKQNQHGQLEPLHVEQILAVKNPNQEKSNVIVIACPNCQTVFDNIFACSQHNVYEHNNTEGYYAICPVIHSELLTIEHSPTCSECNQQFTTWTGLQEHWATRTNHCPLTPLFSHQVFHLFVCSFCEKNFTENFCNAAEHVAGHFETEDKSRLLKIEVKQVMLPMRKEKFLGFNQLLDSNGFKDEIFVLQQLCSSNSLTTGLSSAVARLQELKMKLSVLL